MTNRERPRGYRDRNSIVDIQKKLWKENSKKTRDELGMNERFEDHPHADKDKDIGRVNKGSTSGIHDRRRGE